MPGTFYLTVAGFFVVLLVSTGGYAFRLHNDVKSLRVALEQSARTVQVLVEERDKAKIALEEQTKARWAVQSQLSAARAKLSTLTDPSWVALRQQPVPDAVLEAFHD
jgi:hypothetical protein